MRKIERSKVKFPLWRKKVDSSLFQHKGTTLPNWACQTWGIDVDFLSCISKNDPKSNVTIYFDGKRYNGYVTCAKQRRASQAYRLWFNDDLLHILKDTFLMSFMRDIEDRLRRDNSINIEDEIPFWEFLDIEYDRKNINFYFTAHYKQKPSFPELFKRLIGSPIIHKIDDELENKDAFRIYMQGWKPREELDSEIEVDNVLYTLIDTKSRLLYVGEASKLVQRLSQAHQSIKNWDYYRYDVFPNTITKNHRFWLERMLIRNVASFFDSKAKLNRFNISKYKLVNDKIDSV